MPLTLIKNQRNGYNLVHEKFIYRYYREGSGDHQWRCVHYNSGKCRAVCHTTTNTADGDVISCGDHKHAPDPSKINVMSALEKLRHKAATTDEPTSSIVAATVAGVPNAAAVNLGSRRDLGRTVARIRKVNNNIPVSPTTLKDLIVPPRYSVTAKGEPFLLKDIKIDTKKRSERLLIFSTDQNIRYLKQCKILFADGTFKTLPTMFYQLYTLHARIKDKALPLVFVLTTGKSAKLYERMLSEIKILKPEHVTVDFERAFINAAGESFNGVDISGCFFHFTQCIETM
ncbi:uncharacterized protein LOC130674920 isoform X2 [Microplitis mediator]|uniref:uncharacterized protein LOC130674920 isoform X2 n=1 Tax=Microplitis mediator TaxID=375433 RepID=UPI002555EE8C|nr:uncharacterized protein LOC130674920 isoform X2 [Microplitis mediator]